MTTRRGQNKGMRKTRKKETIIPWDTVSGQTRFGEKKENQSEKS